METKDDLNIWISINVIFVAAMFMFDLELSGLKITPFLAGIMSLIVWAVFEMLEYGMKNVKEDNFMLWGISIIFSVLLLGFCQNIFLWRYTIDILIMYYTIQISWIVASLKCRDENNHPCD